MTYLEKFLLSASLLLLVLGTNRPSYALTSILYDGTGGATPASQSFLSCTDINSTASCNNLSPNSRMLLGVSSSNATETSNGVNGGITFDSTSDNAIYAGYSNYNLTSSQPKNSNFPVLAPSTGIQLNFTIKLNSESENNNDTNVRSGFSVIVLTNSLTNNLPQGIEIGFEPDTIFAQTSTFSSPALKANNSSFISGLTSQLTTYSLAIVGNSFNLTGQPSSGGSVSNLLSGSLQTYTASTIAASQVYKIPNLVFLGDDTSEASANVTLTNVTLTTSYVPWEIPGGAPLVSIGSLLTLGLLRRLGKLGRLK